MKKLLLTTAALVCLAGCHRTKAHFLDFTLTPDNGAKTLLVQCNGSSSGKCGFSFSSGSPTTALLDPGGSITVTGLAAGSTYCAGSRQPDATTCHQVPMPTERATVHKEAKPAASGSNNN